MGGYIGFRRFYVEDRGSGEAIVDPQAWVSAASIKFFGGEVVRPSTDTTTFEKVYERVCG